MNKGKNTKSRLTKQGKQFENKHIKKRTTIEKNIKEKAFLYYAKGLTVKEVGKLLDVSYRTIQNWQVDEKWTDKLSPDNIKLKCVMFKEKGLTYKEISHLLKISTSTIQRYIKEVSEKEKAK